MTPLRVEFTGPAAEELDAALAYLLARNGAAAVELYDALQEALGLLASRTLRGRIVTLVTGERVERWVVRPWVIYLRRDADALVVLHLRDGRRAPSER